MSSVSAGKFQDHYIALGVDPKADLDTIRKAHEVLVEKFHPRNRLTGNREMLDAIDLAMEVLSDPLLRKEFDKLKGVNKDDGAPKFSGPVFFDALGQAGGLRTALMCVLYDRRRMRPFAPSLSMRHVEGMMRSTEEELNFVVWYLKQRGLVMMDDKSSLQITVEGMDYLEAHPPVSEDVLPFLKPEALAVPVAQESSGIQVLGRNLAVA